MGYSSEVRVESRSTLVHKPCGSCGAPGLFVVNGGPYCSDHATMFIKGELHITYMHHKFVDGMCLCGQTEFRPAIQQVVGNVRFVRVRK